jgi:hypothetical protein
MRVLFRYLVRIDREMLCILVENWFHAQKRTNSWNFSYVSCVKVALPSPHHQLAVREDLAQLHQQTATVVGLQPGTGQVTRSGQCSGSESGSGSTGSTCFWASWIRIH